MKRRKKAAAAKLAVEPKGWKKRSARMMRGEEGPRTATERMGVEWEVSDGVEPRGEGGREGRVGGREGRELRAGGGG